MKEVLTEKVLLEKTSQELTSILYKTCIDKLEKAIVAINNNDYEDANNLLQRCNDIIYRLGAGIKYEAGQIADRLDNLYNYIAEVLIEANLKKNIEPLEIVLKIMNEISDAWDVAMLKSIDKGKLNKKVLLYGGSLNDDFNGNEQAYVYHK